MNRAEFELKSRKQGHVSNLNFGSNIPFIAVSALELRTRKESFVLESFDSDSGVVIQESRQSKAKTIPNVRAVKLLK